MIHRIFDVNLSPGLADILSAQQNHTSIIQSSPAASLDLLSAGQGGVSSKTQQFESKTFMEMLSYWKKEYSFVVFDTSPVWDESHTVRLARVADGVIMVVEAEGTRWEVAQRAKKRLADGGANLIGGILNKRRFYVPTWLYKTI
jgi:Mrp family chromosome partitioning ATPase